MALKAVAAEVEAGIRHILAVKVLILVLELVAAVVAVLVMELLVATRLVQLMAAVALIMEATEGMVK
jgi:hypothetical protein